MYTHCQHTFMFKQHVKVHLAFDDSLSKKKIKLILLDSSDSKLFWQITYCKFTQSMVFNLLPTRRMASFFSNPTVQQQSLASQRRVVCGQIPLFIENFLMFVNFSDNNVVCVIFVTEKITRLYKRRWMFKGDDSNRLLLAIAKRLSTSNRRYRCSYITTFYYSAFILVASITFNIVYLKE